MKLASNWRLLMVAIGLATAGCSGAEPADSTIDERTSREVSERLKHSIGDGPQSFVCGDGKCKNGEDCSTCSADCGTCGACAHDLCIPGPALDAACDPNAAQICAVDPFCCDHFWDGLCVSEVVSVCGGTCEGVCGDSKCDGNEDCKSCAADCGTCGNTCNHDECVTGDKLSAACSKCAEDVCAVDPFCCNVAWDGLCVQEVDQYCKKGCGGNGPPKCGDGVCDVNAGESCGTCASDCGACPTCGDGVCDPMTENCQSCAADCGSCGGTCDHDTCTMGGPLDPSCDKCTAAICAVDSFCCTTNWDGICVNEVQTVCGDSSCSNGSCGDGVCDAMTGESCWSCPGDCGACPAPTCGDGICDAGNGEDCSICAADCGACNYCGDGICDAAVGEDCGNCTLDCGACGTCDHDQCTTGGPLAASCNKCVDLICQTDMFCCTSAWDAVCISEVGSICGETCTTSCGDSVCDASIGEDCSSCAADCGACPVPTCGDGKCDQMALENCQSCAADCGPCGAACAHDICVTGAPLDASCSTCTDKICQVDAFCCTSAWDALCVDEVSSICGQTCPASP